MVEVESTVPMEELENDLHDDQEDLNSQTVIQNRYAFWYHRRGGKSQNQTSTFINYEESMKQLASFQTIEHFWRIYNHMIRPSDIRSTTDYHLFKDGIKPTWEDPQNKNGGKWMVRLKKGLASVLWEEIVLSVIGEQFDVGHEICGAVVSVRNGEDIISVWNKSADNVEATNKIREHMRKVLKLPSYVQIEYKKHMDSLADKSSFRNPTLVWKPKDNLNQRSGYLKEGGDKDGGHHNKEGGGGSNSGHYNKDGGGGGHYNKDGQHSNNKERDDGDGGNRWKGREGSGSNWSNRDNTNQGSSNNNLSSTGGSGGGDGWSNRTHKKRDEGGQGSAAAAASAADWIHKRTPNSGFNNRNDKSRNTQGGNSESENVWSRRTTNSTSASTNDNNQDRSSN